MYNSPIPVIAIFDVGKTNKKLLLFDENYNLVFERTAKFLETQDEDGDFCENLESLRLSIFDSLHQLFRMKQYEVKAINFASYGASLVYVDQDGMPLAPLYNYLKPYPPELADEIYLKYGGKDNFALQTASPLLGSLNSALQLYRLKKQSPEIYTKTKYALHLPQYLSFLISGTYCSDMTSIGCHTAMWDFKEHRYHQWMNEEGLINKMAPITTDDQVFAATFPGSKYCVGSGLHDSSSALIPYLINFKDPFLLISTGTWCITLNPFAENILSIDELKKDCLFYLTYNGRPVKASRLFAGYEHEIQIKRISNFFDVPSSKFKSIDIDWSIVATLTNKYVFNGDLSSYANRKLESFDNYNEAYHCLMMDLVHAQMQSINLVLDRSTCKRIFVDGGFSKNSLYMSLLAHYYHGVEVFAASMAQATALGAALSIHEHWNSLPLPTNLIDLKYYRNS